jgi:DNA gyrase/topoisomerase IV subunit B
MTEKNVTAFYGTSAIEVFPHMEAVRRRPTFFLGGADQRALHHLVFEMVDQAVVEVLAGECDTITVTIHADSSVTVTDNGPGLPVGPHPTWKDVHGQPLDVLEAVMTQMFAC